MSISNEIFIKIDFKDFKLNSLVPVKVYLWREDKPNVVEFLPANTAMEQEHLSLCQSLASCLAIPVIKQRDEELYFREFLKEEIPCEKNNHAEFVEKLNTLLVSSLIDENFTPLMEFIREKLSSLDLHISYNTSLLKKLSEKILIRDNNLVRSFCLSYVIYNNLNRANIDKCPSFINNMNAVLFNDIGFLYLDQSLHQLPQNQYTKGHQQEYKKHPDISAFLIKKLDPHINEDLISLVKDQHEHPNGSGFPSGKKNDYVRSESVVMNFAQYLVDYSEGKIHDEKTHLLKLISVLARNERPPNFNFQLLPENLAFLNKIVKKFNELKTDIP